jgi:hypothetical protein
MKQIVLAALIFATLAGCVQLIMVQPPNKSRVDLDAISSGTEDAIDISTRNNWRGRRR